MGTQEFHYPHSSRATELNLTRHPGFHTEDRTRLPCITMEESREKPHVARKPISFLIDVGATFCALPEFLGATHPCYFSIGGIDGFIAPCGTIPALTGSLHNSAIATHFLYSPRWTTLQIQSPSIFVCPALVPSFSLLSPALTLR